MSSSETSGSVRAIPTCRCGFRKSFIRRGGRRGRSSPRPAGHRSAVASDFLVEDVGVIGRPARPRRLRRSPPRPISSRGICTGNWTCPWASSIRAGVVRKSPRGPRRPGSAGAGEAERSRSKSPRGIHRRKSGGKNWRTFLDDLRSWQTKAEKAIEAQRSDAAYARLSREAQQQPGSHEALQRP